MHRLNDATKREDGQTGKASKGSLPEMRGTNAGGAQRMLWRAEAWREISETV